MISVIADTRANNVSDCNGENIEYSNYCPPFTTHKLYAKNEAHNHNGHWTESNYNTKYHKKLDRSSES